MLKVVGDSSYVISSETVPVFTYWDCINSILSSSSLLDSNLS